MGEGEGRRVGDVKHMRQLATDAKSSSHEKWAL